VIREKVADIVTVPDEGLVSAMRFLLERMKIVVEPTGCLAAAAAFSGAVSCENRRVGVILSGGNVDPVALARHLA
jgi:threo-3-hydroxy-L-aspartate ammonia-lyase